MTRIAILTDTSCGLNSKEASEFGIHILPFPIILNNSEYLDDGESFSREKLVKIMIDGEIPLTSQPTIGLITKTFESLLKVYDYVIYIVLSSGLSGTYETAKLVASNYNDKILIADTRKVSSLMLYDALYAKKLVDAGEDIIKIYKSLMERRDSDIALICPENLTYLRRGGRITTAAAALGNLLGIKPILIWKDGIIDKYDKVRSLKRAHRHMIEIFEQKKFSSNDKELHIIHAGCLKTAKEYERVVAHTFPNFTIKIFELAINIICHTGPGTIVLAAVDKI